MKATKWWQNTAVYQIYPKSFNDTHGKGTGDLRGITEKLDYLKELGAGALWLTPVYPSPMVDNGYDISDYTGINPQFGTLADMEELIAEAKKRDMRIVMDLVYNHSSDQHPWFIESKSSRNNPKSDWYIWRDAKEDGSAPTNWRGIFGGSAWTYCAERDQYYLHTFAEAQPDLNWENPEVRAALFAAANFWLDKGVGGFRIDAITYIKKPAVFADGTPDAADGMVSVHDMTANTPGMSPAARYLTDTTSSPSVRRTASAPQNSPTGSAKTACSPCSLSLPTSSSPTKAARHGARCSRGS